MKQKKTKLIALICAAVLVLAALVYAAGGYGSSDDPLVAKSYLDSVLLPELEQEMADALADAEAQLRSGSGSFTVLTLQSGQTVVCQIGCQILPRIGSVKASGPDYPVLVDLTSAASAANGAALTTNHLYMVTIAGNGFTATANNTKVIISGEYAVQ